ncbi:MAG: hypothetical protein LBH43_01490 [Treponema sp.]|nr:hypothetical protein [Treponema sp.]
MMKSIGIPAGNEIAYKGEIECSCGNIVKVTFLIEAFKKGQERQNHQIVMRGNF